MYYRRLHVSAARDSHLQGSGFRNIKMEIIYVQLYDLPFIGKGKGKLHPRRHHEGPKG
jgi:hypothetical protein